MVDIRGNQQDEFVNVNFVITVPVEYKTGWFEDEDGDLDKEAIVRFAQAGLEELIAHESMDEFLGYVVCPEEASAMGDTFPCAKELGHMGSHGGYYD